MARLAAATRDARAPAISSAFHGRRSRKSFRRARMFLGYGYRIRGTNAPETIGHAVTSGGFRLVNDDVADLYDRVNVGTRVIVRPN